MRIKAISMCIAVSILMLVAIPVSGAASTSVRVEVKTPSNKGVSLVSGLEPEDNLPEGTYQAKARVELTTEGTPEVVDSRKLELLPAPDNEDIPGDWIRRDGAWIWTTAVKTAPLPLSFQPEAESADTSGSLTDYDELWFDFDKVLPGEPCRINVSLEAAVHDDERENSKKIIRFISNSHQTFSQLSSVDVVHAGWKPKGTLYLVKRELGLGFDTDWRYIQDQPNVVIQRRFHQSLKNVSAIDILLLPDVDLDNLNLMVCLKENSSPVMINLSEIPKDVQKTPEGQRVRLYLGEVIYKRLAAEKLKGPAFLSEIVLFFHGDVASFVASRPLRFVNFLMAGEKSDEKIHDVISLPQHEEKLAHGWRRLVVDLRPLANIRWSQLRLIKAMLKLYPSSPLNFSGVKPLSLRLVSLDDGKRPVYYRTEVLPYIKNFGGPFLTLSDPDNTVEWVAIDDNLPLTRMMAVSRRLTLRRQDVVFPDAGLTVSRDVIKPEPELHGESKSKFRRKFRGRNPVARTPDSRKAMDVVLVKTNENGLIIDGQKAETVSLRWALPEMHLKTKSYFILNMDQGAKKVRKAILNIAFQDGTKLSIPFIPNRATIVGNAQTAGKKLQSVIVTLQMNSSPFRLQLKDILFFHPFVVPASEANRTPWPHQGMSPLNAVNVTASGQCLAAVSKSMVHGVIIGGSQPPGVLSWRTPVHLPVQSVNALQIHYRLGVAPISPDWLTVTLTGKKKNVRISLSPEKSEDQLTVLLVKYRGEFQRGEQLQSVFWQVHLPPIQGEPAVFQFQTGMDANLRPSLLSLIQDHAFITSGQRTLRPTAMTDALSDHFGRYNFGWIDLGQFHWPGGKFPLEFNTSPYFRMTQVILENNNLSASAFWNDVSAKNLPRKSSWFFRILTIVSAMGIAGVSWLYRRQLITYLGCCRALLRSGAGVVWFWICWSLNGFWTFLLRHKLLINRAVSICVIAPVCFLIGRLTNTIIIFQLLAALFLLICGVMRHEIHWRQSSLPGLSPEKAGKNDSAETEPVFIIAITVIGLGLAAWSLGRGQVLGVMPMLLAIFYIHLKWFLYVFQWLQHSSGRFVFWFLMTLCLYAGGVFRGPGTGENYWFTFGGMAAIVSWRFMCLSLRTWLQNNYPKIADRIYGGAGTLYFSGALAGLVMTAFLLTVKLEPLAEQVAVIVYYFLVVGTVLEVVALRRESRANIHQTPDAGATP